MDNTSRTAEQNAVIDTFRSMWQQYFLNVIKLVINILCGLAGTVAVTEQLKESLQDFVAEFEKYYGFESAQKFEILLDAYTIVAIKLMESIKDGDLTTARFSRLDFAQIADEISDLFASVNPYWEKGTWEDLINKHTALVEQQFVYRCGDFDYSQIMENPYIKNQLIEISDYMAEGIIRQFNI